MSSLHSRKSAVKKLKKLYLAQKAEVKTFRAELDSTFETAILPNKVEKSSENYGGVPCDVLSPEIYSSHKVVLYVHGGCFAGGSRNSYRAFCSVLAHAAKCRVVVPEFRLAPTSPFPAAGEDVMSVFKALYSEEYVALSLDEKFDAEKEIVPEIIVMADGSGASVALSMIQSLSLRLRKGVKNIILFSPWLDVSDDCELVSEKKIGDELLTGEMYRRARDLYTFPDNMKNPLVSPAKADADVLKSFAPIFIQMGGKEALLGSVRGFQKKVIDAGGSCVLDVWENMMGMFQLADEFLDESHLAVERVGKFLNERKVSAEDSQTAIQIKLETKEDYGRANLP